MICWNVAAGNMFHWKGFSYAVGGFFPQKKCRIMKVWRNNMLGGSEKSMWHVGLLLWQHISLEMGLVMLWGGFQKSHQPTIERYCALTSNRSEIDSMNSLSSFDDVSMENYILPSTPRSREGVVGNGIMSSFHCLSQWGASPYTA